MDLEANLATAQAELAEAITHATELKDTVELLAAQKIAAENYLKEAFPQPTFHDCWLQSVKGIPFAPDRDHQDEADTRATIERLDGELHEIRRARMDADKLVVKLSQKLADAKRAVETGAVTITAEENTRQWIQSEHERRKQRAEAMRAGGVTFNPNFAAQARVTTGNHRGSVSRQQLDQLRARYRADVALAQRRAAMDPNRGRIGPGARPKLPSER